MKDSTLKDSLLRTGFSGLREMVEEMFPEEVEEPIEENSDGEGGIIEAIEVPEVKKPEPPKTSEVKPIDKKKQEEKPKDPPKKGKE
ncbi:MAG: hypothetical protein IPN46_09260 [Saprospiraceae bacterium]|nr:hypothetical protein [Saprospiraceae bacterium]